MRHPVRIAVACAALVALALPTFAGGQGGGVAISETSGSSFPDRKYLVELPRTQALTAAGVEVTENGNPVSSVAVTPPGGSASGAVLLIDASNSMQGAPIESAMAAARGFLAERKDDLPVAIVVFGPEDTVLTDFSTDKVALAEAIEETPATAEGTHIYDALSKVVSMAEDKGLGRTTVVLLSDGTDVGSETSRAEALQEAADANVRVISVGLSSSQYDPETLKALANRTGGTYVETATPAELQPVFREIGQQLAREYELSYRSLMPPNRETTVVVAVQGYTPARATYTTPALDLQPRGTFDRSWIDSVITSPWLMMFVVVAVFALIGFAILSALDVRKRSIRRRMAQYVTVPTEEESRLRRAEVAQFLAEATQKTVGGHRWWQNFERNVDLGGFGMSPLGIAGWTIVAGITASIVCALVFQSLWGLLLGLAAPFVTHAMVKIRVSRKRAAFGEQLPDNLDVIAGSLRAGHSLIGSFSVMMEGSDEPSKTEFRRVLQDEQLGVPVDQALMVMRHRMDNPEVEQLAIVTRLQAEAGGNTAEVLDRVAENIRARLEIKRLIRVLTAQGRLAMWVLIGMPIAMIFFISVLNPRHLEPLFDTTIGNISIGAWVVMMILGWYLIRKIVDIEL